MGNSMRSFLGNMCGAEDSKRLANEGAQENRPVQQEHAADAKPSEEVEGNATTEPAGESFQTCPVETSGSHSPFKKKHRSGSQKKFPHIQEVEGFKPEVVNVSEADNIFKKSAETYKPFADDCTALRKAVDSFEAVFSSDKKRADLEQAITAFQELLKANAEADEEKRSQNRDKIDAGREHHKAIVATGYKVLDDINLVRPQIEEDVAAAEKLDIKESTKSSQSDGTQLGLVSKLSVPGKHRRNIKALKRCETQLGQVADETQEILAVAERVKVDVPVTTPEDQQPAATATVPLATADTDEGSSDPAETASNPVPVPGARPSETSDVASSAPAGDAQRSATPDAAVSSSLPNGSTPRPRGASFTGDCDEGEGKMVDYGSFWMLNPSGDDMALVKRSRSLDSVVSRGSRASMSRYGSYEFVTNMEIQIAEKGEAQRAANTTTADK